MMDARLGAVALVVAGVLDGVLVQATTADTLERVASGGWDLVARFAFLAMLAWLMLRVERLLQENRRSLDINSTVTFNLSARIHRQELREIERLEDPAAQQRLLAAWESARELDDQILRLLRDRANSGRR